MQERRRGDRHVVSFPVRVEWKDTDGQSQTEEGLTENIGLKGALIYLPRLLPDVGSKVDLIITENPEDEVTVKAEVLRLERNASHPQAALHLTKDIRKWKAEVWDLATKMIEEQEPEVEEF